MYTKESLAELYIGASMIMVLAILYFAVIREKYANDIRNRYLKAMILLAIFFVSSSLAGDYFVTYDGQYKTGLICVALNYIAESAILVLFSAYETACLNEKTYVSTAPLYFIIFILGFFSILWVSVIFGTNIFFYISPEGYGVFFDTYRVSLIAFYVVLLYDVFLAFSCSKDIDRSELVTWIYFIFVPAVITGFRMISLNTYFSPLCCLSILILYVGVHNKHSRELAENEVNITEEKARLKLNQIQPQFIESTLDSIYELIDDDLDMAQEGINIFSNFLRANINSLKTDELIPLTNELETVRNYIKLQEIDRGYEFFYEEIIKDDSIRVPALSLQSLVELSFEMGMASMGEEGYISIQTEMQNDGFLITYYNNIIKSVDFESNVFEEELESINNRFEKRLNATTTVYYADDGTELKIFIPLKKDDNLKKGGK